MSFAKTSACTLQLKDNNDYYPFGMNHLKTGNAYFGQGSYKNYKFGGKELQEFGAYDFGARIYMVDIGRWFVTDPMAEVNPGLTTYRYGFNNPIMFTDPNGMLEQAQIDHMWNNSGNGGITSWSFNVDGSPKKGTFSPMDDSYIDNTLSALYGVSSEGGSATFHYWTGAQTVSGYISNNELFGNHDFGVLHQIKVQREVSSEFDWYGLAGKGNWFFGTAGVLSGFAGVVQSQHMYTQGIRRGISGNYQLTGRNLSQFGSMAMTDATQPISKIGRVAKGIGTASFYLGFTFDTIGLINGKISTGKWALNTGFGIAGNWGGSIGASVSTVYFAVDNFYDDEKGNQGWPGFFNNANSTQRFFDEGINNVGSYRVNIFGTHEPK